MSKDAVYDVLLALPSLGDCLYLEQILKRQDVLKVSTRRIEDPYNIITELKEASPHLLIVSPLFLSDTLIQYVRKEIEGQLVRMVAYCKTLHEDQFTKNYDGKILITDSENDIVNVLEGVLSIETDEEEELLTPREKDVVVSVVKGMTNKEIADQFCLSPHTIITHRRNIARKLNIHSPSGLTIYAIMNKLVSLEDIKDL